MAPAGVIELRLLGPLELVRSGTPLRLGGLKPRALLAILALRLGEVVSKDLLVDALWGDTPPKEAAHAVEVYVSELRSALEPERALLAMRRPGYALELDPDQVDAHRAAALAAEGRFAEALALWRGDSLADFTYEPFAQVEIARLEDLRRACVRGRLEADLSAGRHAEVIGELRALVATELSTSIYTGS